MCPNLVDCAEDIVVVLPANAVVLVVPNCNKLVLPANAVVEVVPNCSNVGLLVRSS